MDDKLYKIFADKFDATVNVVNYYGILGYSITVCIQADKYITEHVDQRIEKFLKSFNKILELDFCVYTRRIK